MPRSSDFRSNPPFCNTSVIQSGSFVGKNIYWKLYVIENIYRVIINSILIAQIGPNWWTVAVDPKTKEKAEDFKKEYLKRPWHTSPGKHDIYYITLYQLNNIARVNSHLFSPLITDIDQWIVKIEGIRLPRNIVAHMNFPDPTDKSRIDVLYGDFINLLSFVSEKITLEIPV